MVYDTQNYVCVRFEVITAVTMKNVEWCLLGCYTV
jgi:hypothetical protein